MDHCFSGNSLVVLDCTLRDGGYYNLWDFDTEVVSRYFQSVEAAGIDALEVGFRFVPKDKFLGAFAYSADHFLSRLPLPKNCLIAVMLNAKDFASCSEPARLVTELFHKAVDSPLDLVRICSLLDGICVAQPVTEELKKLGYRICVNLMQVAGKTPEQLISTVSQVSKWGTVDVLYFADSLGSMGPAQVKELIKIIRPVWKGLIGIHAHDNKGRALANTLAAIDSGVTWIDGTILGMGRGAGNTYTEHLLVELRERGLEKYGPEALFTIVMEDFNSLRKKYGWGYNLLYYLSASYGIHPTYIQEMTSSLHYDTPQMLEGLKTLKRWVASSFSQDRLREAMLGDVSTVDGKWSAKNWLKGGDVLIIGPGPKGRTYTPALIEFIDRCKPFVISLNSDTSIPPEKVDTYAVCHYTRLITELDRYTNFGTPILMPFGILPENIRSKISKLSILDYGIRVKSHTFKMGRRSCIIPGFLVAPYVFSAVTVGGAGRIFLAGFDGYGVGDPRQEEMAEVIGLYKASKASLPLIAITPSTYDVEQSSVYSMGIV